MREAMSDALFAELRESVRQGGEILRGARQPSRAFTMRRRSRDAVPNVARLRARFGLSQAKFAVLLGISVATLRNWEQGRRAPEGPARVLLRVAARHPGVVLSAVAADR